MAASMEYTPSCAYNLQVQCATTFDMAVKLGLASVGLEVGNQVIQFVYDKARKAWQFRDQSGAPFALGDAAAPMALGDAAAPAAEMSPLRQQNLEGRLAEVHDNQVDEDIAEFQASRRPLSLEEADWARRSKAVAPQQPQTQGEPLLPRPLQLNVAVQKQRLETGQQMVPVDDDNHDNPNDDHKVPDQTEHQA